MANLVVCCDGTWNTPDDTENGLPSPTNVCKIYNAVRVVEEADRPLTYYHPGVGTDGGLLDKFMGGSIGAGLGRNVKSAYRWLAAHYRPGDRIWLFGFSRGAFTARCVAGMVTRYGLRDLSDPHLSASAVWEAVDAVYEKYREGNGERAPGRYFNAEAGGLTQVFFVGVWDTVGSLGVPDDMAFLDLFDDPRQYQFHDTDLNDNVLNARHALALDEMRQSFIPTLWTGVENRADTVKQVWFPGVHSDVGGGYADTALSDAALCWMIEEARALGLEFHDVGPQLKSDPIGFLHDSCSGVFKLLPTRPRNVPAIVDENVGGSIHETVMARVRGQSLQQARYRRHRPVTPGNPVTVDVFAGDRWNGTGIFLEKGVRYRLSATGEWMDSALKAGPQGTEDGRFEPAEVAHVVSKALGALEGAYKGLFGTKKANFAGTLRHGNSDFLALIGVIASGGGAEEDWLQEQFVIGRGKTITPKESGYLHCFANDVWLAYENNRGSIRLTVAVA